MGSVDHCAGRIRESILGGEISAGTRLPPERALAERFGVNRVTVRGALARLEAEGLVDVRQGSGPGGRSPVLGKDGAADFGKFHFLQNRGGKKHLTGPNRRSDGEDP
jgi:DNA-binding transcriptional MocR family regulator